MAVGQGVLDGITNLREEACPHLHRLLLAPTDLIVVVTGPHVIPASP